MKKIMSLFQRNYDGDRLVRDEIVPGAEWVVAGEGICTRKFDGTCCLVRDGKLYKRYEVKPGGKQPANFEPANEVDDVTGKQQGWVPLGDGPEDRWHREAWENQNFADERGTKIALVDGTYELCGPKVQGNPESGYVESEVGPNKHLLIPHGCYIYGDKCDSFSAIRELLRKYNIEGFVWHHPDGRMVKIKLKDFGIKRG